MVPDPLHPAVVHFPIVLVVLLPIFALGSSWAIRRGASARRAWALPLALAAVLMASAWAAVRTGEAQEDRVEGVVSERALHEHEEAAERFLLLSGLLLAVAATGLAGGTVGRAGRLLSTAGSFGLVLAGVQVGASGGELVYRHGAASAYTSPAAESAAPVRAAAGADDERD